jgi:inorganic pyrophosphatase
MMYPADYGIIRNTLALDVLVLVTEPTFPGIFMEVNPFRVFHMADEKGPDEKIICVPVSDPIWNRLNDLDELNGHLLKEIEHFFRVYKDLEKKKVDVGGFGDATEAKKIIKQCIERYENYDGDKSRFGI